MGDSSARSILESQLIFSVLLLMGDSFLGEVSVAFSVIETCELIDWSGLLAVSVAAPSTEAVDTS